MNKHACKHPPPYGSFMFGSLSTFNTPAWLPRPIDSLLAPPCVYVPFTLPLPLPGCGYLSVAPVYPPPARARNWKKLIASAMLQEEWESARRLVSVAAAGAPRQTLARELIPAATEAGVFEVATRLIEDHNLVSEFPNYNELLVCYVV